MTCYPGPWALGMTPSRDWRAICPAGATPLPPAALQGGRCSQGSGLSLRTRAGVSPGRGGRLAPCPIPGCGGAEGAPSACPEPTSCIPIPLLQKAFPKAWATAPCPFLSAQPSGLPTQTVVRSSEHTHKPHQAHCPREPGNRPPERVAGGSIYFSSFCHSSLPQPQPTRTTKSKNPKITGAGRHSV